ncbi:MAG: hypothetical protein OES24_22080 [Acidimicrobiia bacterium]|nr:hypothetical protein [Acidimicrobiia bacterium]
MEPVIDEFDVDLAADRIANRRRQGHTTWVGSRLDAGSHVDSVAVDVSGVIGHHLAEVDSDSELHAPCIRQVAVPLTHELLHLDCSGQGSTRGGKLQQRAVAGGLHDPAPVVEHDRVDDVAVRPQGCECPFLVVGHQEREADNISEHDRSQPASTFHGCEDTDAAESPSGPRPPLATLLTAEPV